MNINAAIIDQQLIGLMDLIRERSKVELGINDDIKLKSLAFVDFTIKTILDISEDEAFECLTEGGGDFGVDAIHISEEYDGEFTVTIFQGKYKNNLEANSNFPDDGILKLVNAVRHIFDPKAPLNHICERLETKVEEIRSLIKDFYAPQIRIIACNNGLIWNKSADEEIQRASFGERVSWEYVNHENLVMILQTSKKVNHTLRFTGRALDEDINFFRIFMGRMAVSEVASLIDQHGERLLERNVRRYLGLQGNKVNEAIRETLLGEDRANFYFYNNGITLTCDKFSRTNTLQQDDYPVIVENLQIINGGQTCMTIYKTLRELRPEEYPVDAFVLVRLYQLPSSNDDLVKKITYATNSQNPVNLKDLKANDNIQCRLELDISQLGYSYRRKRVDASTKSTDITSGAAAEAILAVWRRRPHQAKFFTREHFGRLYDIIFSPDLNGAQTIIASLIYRIPESRRRKITSDDPSFIRYGSCFIAMQMGKYLLYDLNCDVTELSHRNFSTAKQLIEEKNHEYFDKAVEDIEIALKVLYGVSSISLQQLSATFRRGDLIEILERN